MSAPRIVSSADFTIGGLVFHAIFLAVAIPATIVDLRSFRIPDCIVYPGIIVLVAFLAIAMPGQLVDSLIAAALATCFLWLIRIFTKGPGFGDVKFGACMGLYCGTQAIFPAFMLAALSGIFVAVILVNRKKMTRTARIPFAPFLALGAISGRIIVDLYCR